MLPACEHIQLVLEQGILHLTLNRPKQRNAISKQMVAEVTEVLTIVATKPEVRAIFVRGSGGHFCAGGDLKEASKSRAEKWSPGERDPIAVLNRQFGKLCSLMNQCPKAVVAIVEGTAMGGGFGLVCVADIVVAKSDASFRLPETGLGLIPAQITPFLVQRLGLPTARRLALTGARLNGQEGKREGLVDIVVNGEEELEEQLSQLRQKILRCAPQASVATKELLLAVGTEPVSELLDRGADLFAEAARSAEGMEGIMAFLGKRKPKWCGEQS